MENQSNQATKKGLILLLGIIIGLLTGVAVTAVLVSKLNMRHQHREDQPPLPPPPGNSDTIYKYIVHKYEPQSGESMSGSNVDSLMNDSLYVDDGSMDYMLDDEDYPMYMEPENGNVASERVISKQDVPVLYFDAAKNPIPAPDNSPKFMEVQFWSTPIHNKVVYQYENNILKVKGLKQSNPQIIFFNGHYYLQNEKRVYQIVPATEFRRLVEVRDVTFK
jgi:hypothetical protein